jgi:hypothetical protein
MRSSRPAALRLLLDVLGILKARIDLSMPYPRSGRLNAGRWAAMSITAPVEQLFCFIRYAIGTVKKRYNT